MIAIALLIGLHIYVFARLVPALGWPTSGNVVVLAVLLLLSCVAIPFSMRTRTMAPPWAQRSAWLGFTLMGSFSSLLVLTLLRDVALLSVSWLLPDPAVLARVSAQLVVALTVLATLVGLFNARRRAAVVEVEVRLEGLPFALQGFSIAQISDVHVGQTIRQGYVAAIVAAVNQLRPDVIVITGDLVDGSVQQLASHVAPLAGLQARHGTYFVTGNHEYYSGVLSWVAELRRLGLHVLLNEHVVLQHQGACLVLAGVTDFSAHHFNRAERSDPALALRGAPLDATPKILLAHQPRSAAAAAAAGFDLQLSGHTHGGQFWPWNLFVRMQQPFTAGLDRLERMWIYTSRGTGYWGPPKRLGAPSEITRITLVRA
jgi:predicted MPP superfamily phosphohydrolase